MVRNASIITVRKWLRTILIMMVAVIASMSLHHGAMAASPAAHDHSAAHLDLPVGEADCLVDCDARSHSMPACCGMGLCLSGLPVGPQSARFAPALVSDSSYHRNLSPRSWWSRIDRPPKNSVRAAV